MELKHHLMFRTSEEVSNILILAGAGAILFVAYIIEDEIAATALTGLGITTIIALHLWKGPQRFTGHSVDNRSALSYYRAGWYSYLLLSWVVAMYVGVEILAQLEPPAELLFTGFICVAIAFGVIKKLDK